MEAGNCLIDANAKNYDFDQICAATITSARDKKCNICE